jgi:hypothetical protein
MGGTTPAQASRSSGRAGMLGPIREPRARIRARLFQASPGEFRWCVSITCRRQTSDPRCDPRSRTRSSSCTTAARRRGLTTRGSHTPRRGPRGPERWQWLSNGPSLIGSGTSPKTTCRRPRCDSTCGRHPRMRSAICAQGLAGRSARRSAMATDSRMTTDGAHTQRLTPRGLGRRQRPSWAFPPCGDRGASPAPPR